MYYGYALYYKDQDGFELPLFQRCSNEEMVWVTPYEKIAQTWFEREHEDLIAELNPKVTVVVKGWWKWKKTQTFPGRRLPPDEYRFKMQVFNTLFIKKVKLV